LNSHSLTRLALAAALYFIVSPARATIAALQMQLEKDLMNLFSQATSNMTRALNKNKFMKTANLQKMAAVIGIASLAMAGVAQDFRAQTHPSRQRPTRP
jgi:5-keto 4-deoxyuronate isomerase